MNKNNYIIYYQSNGEMIEELYNTLEIIIIFIVAKIKRDVRIIEVKRCDFYD